MENRQIFINRAYEWRCMESIIVNYTCYEHTSAHVLLLFGCACISAGVCAKLMWCDVHLCAGDYHSSMANVCARKTMRFHSKGVKKKRLDVFIFIRNKYEKHSIKRNTKPSASYNCKQILCERVCMRRLCLFIIVQWAARGFSVFFVLSFWSSFGLHSKLMCIHFDYSVVFNKYDAQCERTHHWNDLQTKRKWIIL